MRNYLKLLNFEFNRFFKLYMLLFSLVAIVQTGTVIFSATSYMQIVKEANKTGMMAPEQFILDYWKYSLTEAVYTLSFMTPIGISIVGLLFYMIFIWYRDWFARNTFIYRLLMLPTNRMNIFYAKLTTVMITVFGMVALQLILFLFYKQLVTWIVPVVYREEIGIGYIIQSSEYLGVIIPNGFGSFLISYGIGLASVIVVFTAILFERSYRLIGAIYGLLYVAITILFFVSPFIIQYIIFNNFYLYDDEAFWLQTFLLAVIIGCSLMISNYLLHKKVTV